MSVRSGRDLPEGHLSQLRTEQEVTDGLAEICQLKSAPLKRQVDALRSRIDCVEDELNGELDKRYNEPRIHGPHEATEERLRQLE